MVKVLIIDDQAFARTLIACSLNHAGIETMEVSNYDEAVISWGKERPALVLSDYDYDGKDKVPSLGGLDFLTYVRQQEDHIPFIFHTGTRRDIFKEVEERGTRQPDTVLTKPTSLHTIVSCVQKFLSQNPDRRERQIESGTPTPSAG